MSGAGGGLGRPEITSLTGLRGIAAWTVALYHMRLEVPGLGPLQPLVNNGEYAVDLFFVMSGFVLALSYGALFARPADLRPFLRFLGYRLARIYPAHIVVLGAFTVVPLAYLVTGRALPGAEFDETYYVLSTVLMQNWGFVPGMGWNVPAWSISTELMFYLAFPPMILLLYRVRPEYLPALLLGLLAALALVGHLSGALVQAIPTTGPLRCLLECALGIWLHQAARLWRPGRAGAVAMTGLAAALAAAFGLGAVPDYLVLPLAATALVWALLEPRNPLGRVLSWAPLLWLGRVSFSTYIVHYLAKDLVKMGLGGRVPPAAVLAAYLLAVLALSALLHHVVERPGQRAGWRLTETLLARMRWLPSSLPAEQPE